MEAIKEYIFRALLVSTLLFAGEGVMWGTYYANLKVTVYPSSSAGKAYLQQDGGAVEGYNVITVETTSGGNVDINIDARPENGYHFKTWGACTGDGNVDAGRGTAFNPLSKSEWVRIQGARSNNDTYNYTMTVTFEENFCTSVSTQVASNTGGSAYVSYGEAFSGTATTANDGHGQVSAYVSETYSLKAVPSSGYVFERWEVVNGTIEASSINNPVAQVTVITNSAYQGVANRYPCTVTARFTPYYEAKLTAATSSAKVGTSAGSAYVSTDNSSWSSYATKRISNPNTSVPFHIKATPNKGYQFKGWSESNGSTTYVGTESPATYSVNSSGTAGGVNAKTIYAVFDKGTYTVIFDSGSGAGHVATGTMTDQRFTSTVAQNLKANEFVCDYTVTYDAQGGSCETSSETKGRFKQWNVSTGGSYADRASVNRTEDHGTSLTFTAEWYNAVQFTLPTPTKTKDGVTKTFLGWFTAADGGTKIGDAGETVNISSTQTLYAHWKECNILINTTGTAEGRIVFNATRSGQPATHYRVSIPAGQSLTILDVPSGDYSIVPESDWSWNVTVTPNNGYASFNPGSADSETISVNFSVSSKGSSKKHNESSGSTSY